MMINETELVVVGGGPAGMMAALTAAQAGARVTLLERNPKVGRKLYITGKGRCNVTNHCPPENVLTNTPRNGKFLYSAMNAFPPEAVERWFEDQGVPLKVERGNRVFPRSDKAADIIDALFFALKRQRVAVVNGRASRICLRDGAVCAVEEGNSSKTLTGFPCQAVVLATGGVSYPATGSTGDGYEMAAALGHTIIPAAPSLVPLESPDPACKAMQGLSLRNVGVKVRTGRGKTVYQEQGELLFTHFGLSGPTILSASAHMRQFEKETYTVCIDLKPALDEKKLDARLLRDFEERANSDLGNALGGLLPRAMIPVMLERCGLPANGKVHDLRREERRTLLEHMKSFEVAVSGPRPVEEAIVTSGGVKTAEVDPKTMASKRVPGLFFAGELLDVDAYTGGFNLQIAWATGHAAGLGAADYLQSLRNPSQGG